MIYTSEQLRAIECFKEFLSSDNQIFILKGYAGTGKTTIMKEFVKDVEDSGKTAGIMAPTGRAALILKNKTGYDAYTIHRSIYLLSNIAIDEGNEKEESEIMYRFPLKRLEVSPDTMVHFIDEASMVSSKKAGNEVYAFGSGILLDDLLTYCNPHNGGKIVFIGDPAQLPPVGDNKSNALDKEFLELLGYKVSEFELTKVIRQDACSAILTNATKVRNLLGQKQRNHLDLLIKPGEFEESDEWDTVSQYVGLSPAPTIGSPVIICWTNKSAAIYNTFVRKLYYPRQDLCTPRIGDRLIMTVNRYNEDRDIFNGEMTVIVQMSPTTTTLSAPVYCKENGSIVKKTIPIIYREMTLEFDDHKQVTRQVVETLLLNDKRDLSYEELCSISINFRIRYKHLKPGSLEYEAALKSDPYINACRAKFGYAITGHKSQGGEWNTVFADFSGRTGMDDDSLRWTYTAITRARKSLYAVNLPRLSPFSGLKINEKNRYSKLQEEVFSFGKVPATPYHTESTAPALRAQYFSIEAELVKYDYRINSVQSFPYMERYEIESSDNVIKSFDGRYNKSFVLTFKCTGADTELCRILNNCTILYIGIDYTPSSDSLKQLYNVIKGICSEEDILITNIVEHPESHKVIYYLKTSVQYAYLTVYFDKNEMFTSIIPSVQSENDEKLNKLLTELDAL